MTHLQSKEKIKAILDSSEWFSDSPPSQESFCIVEFNEWLKDKPTDEIFYAIAAIHAELPFRAQHHNIIAVLEMLEGMVAIREMNL